MEQIFAPLILAIVLVMATKLRWESVTQFVADGTTSEDNGSRHTNDSDNDEHIRQIHGRASISTAGPNEFCTAQLSQQNTFLALTAKNNEEEFRILIEAVMNTDVALDSNASNSDHWYFGRGQLILEPGQSLKSSLFKSSGGAAGADWLIGYEFE